MEDKNYNAMTVNERLFESGLLNDFDTALKNKDSGRVIEILRKVLVDENSIQQILKKYNLE